MESAAVIKPGPLSDPYLALLQSIISQQLSVKAAQTIYGRFCALFPGQIPSPDFLLKKSVMTLRRAGLSRSKAYTIQEVARLKLERGLHPEDLQRKTDEEIIKELTQVRGVGVWTAQMLLIFSLNRADVFPVQDVGIQNAMKQLYKLGPSGRGLQADMEKICQRWIPWRSVACRYLWRWLHTSTAQPSRTVS